MTVNNTALKVFLSHNVQLFISRQTDFFYLKQIVFNREKCFI